ncbi:hypothetical protein ABW21_db0206448 [Orbilia brochopaga]|nr:hypothetical protein ABW21_db0206448 [Drechslerella brochopaga]
MQPFLRVAARRAARIPTPKTALRTPSISHILPPRLSPIPPYSRPFSPRCFHTTPPRQSARSIIGRHYRAGIWAALLRWSSRPSFYLELAGLGGVGGGFYLYHVEEVPVSGRRRFNVISPDFEKQLGDSQFTEIQKQYQHNILPDTDPRVRQVRRVLARLIPNSGLPDDYDWQVTVIESDETNAFVIPGGKVFVFTGILPVCGSEDGLAAVLGHEIGHNVARHAAEQMSRGIFLVAAAWMVELLWGIPGELSQGLLQLAVDQPKSRAQESEADYIGLLMMSKSCFDPKAAVTLWERMQVVEKQRGGVPPEILSTHPSSEHRQADLTALLPKAYQIAIDSDCSAISEHVGPFKKFADDFISI